MLKSLAEKINGARSLVLSTHRQCDGDGLGAQVALFHALQKIGKTVRLLNVDETPRKYAFLSTDRIMQTFESVHDSLAPTDMALIFDTNDSRLIEPLYTNLQKQCREIFFIDHHPILIKGPGPTSGSIIDTKAASTGELVYDLIRELEIPLDAQIARSLYTSLVFDTQLFRFVRNSSSSHLMAAELLKFDIQPEEIHRKLFANYSPQKVALLAKAFGQIDYFDDNRIAILKLPASDLVEHGLDLDEILDLIDFMMNIESLEAAVIFREDGPESYKISLRSKGLFEVLSIAEAVGGGGHLYSAGAYMKGNFEVLRSRLLTLLRASLARAS
jgi:phosphoesterase RecJ-like protein